jgi:NitT/TauT family transport system substrate-binding protein
LSRRRLLGIGTAAVLSSLSGAVIGLAGCAKPSPLRIAAHVWPGYELMFLARTQGWLPADQVQLIETQNSTASLAALARGDTDGAALTLDEVLRARANGLALTVTLVFDISAGADALIARPEVRGLKDLAGKRIGAETSALGALMLHKTLAAAGLAPSAVTVVPVASTGHYESWTQKNLDALVTYEPTSGRLEAEGARRLFDSRSLPNMIVDVLAVRADLAAAQAEHLRLLAEAHFRGVRHLQSNPQDAAYRMAGRLALPADRAYDAFRGLQLPALDINRRLLAPTGELLGTAAALSSIMARAGLLPREDDLRALVSDAYLPRGKP